MRLKSIKMSKLSRKCKRITMPLSDRFRIGNRSIVKPMEKLVRCKTIYSKTYKKKKSFQACLS